MSRVAEILNLIQHIPPFPKVVEKSMELLKDPQVTAGDLAEVIMLDSSITANVIKICNAAYFGLPRKVSSLDEALVVLGNDILLDILVASSSAKFYKGTVGAGYQLEQGELWRHSVATAIMAKLLVRYIPGVDSGKAFTSGLLHDIGKRFLSSFVADEFQKIIEKVDKEKCSFQEAEYSIIGINHADLGGKILEKWEFSEELIEATRLHHAPDALSREPLTAITALSNALVISMGIGGGVDGLATEIQGEGLKRFGIGEIELQLCMADLFMEMEKADELLNI